MILRSLALLGMLLITNMASANAFYIRGDFAYSWAWDQTSKIAIDQIPPNASSFDLTVDSVPMGQLGFGYTWNPYVRADITGSLTGERDVSMTCTGSPSTCVPGTKGNFTINTSTIFANVYYEMASLWTQGYSRWHPYIGIGLGSAHQSLNTIQMSANAPGGTLDSSVNSFGQWQFAWRGTAGLAVTLVENLLLDVSYVYMDGGQAQSGEELTYDFITDPLLTKTLTVDMKTQELYLGLRQQF